MFPFDETFHPAHAVLGNNQQVAGMEVGKRLRGGVAYGGLEIQDFGLRRIGADPAKQDYLRVVNAAPRLLPHYAFKRDDFDNRRMAGSRAQHEPGDPLKALL